MEDLVQVASTPGAEYADPRSTAARLITMSSQTCISSVTALDLIKHRIYECTTVVKILQDPHHKPYTAVWAAPNRLSFRADTTPKKGLRGSAFPIPPSCTALERSTPIIGELLGFHKASTSKGGM